jgi:hypothetical protein
MDDNAENKATQKKEESWKRCSPWLVVAGELGALGDER